MKSFSLWFCILSFLLSVPAQAETSPSTVSKPKTGVESKGKPEEKKKKPSKTLVPFAQYEQRLKSSERWKTLSPEEQQEALDKIQHYRKLFRERQAVHQSQYNRLIEKKPKKRKKLSQRQPLEELNFEDVWEKWVTLPKFRQKDLMKRWRIAKARPLKVREKLLGVPSKFREELLKFWKKLLPASRQKFLRDLHSS